MLCTLVAMYPNFSVSGTGGSLGAIGLLVFPPPPPVPPDDLKVSRRLAIAILFLASSFLTMTVATFSELPTISATLPAPSLLNSSSGEASSRNLLIPASSSFLVPCEPRLQSMGPSAPFLCHLSRLLIHVELLPKKAAASLCVREGSPSKAVTISCAAL